MLSIGEVARTSGVSVETLRNWERRYGFPVPQRRRSGHRRYPVDVIPRLELILRCLKLGYKPSFCVDASLTMLRQIIEKSEISTIDKPPLNENPQLSMEVEKWLKSVGKMDAEKLEARIQRAWMVFGARQFVLHLALPFLRDVVGRRWCDQPHTAGHSHFAAELIQSFLASQWRSISNRYHDKEVVMACLEGCHNTLALHMAATLAVMRELSVVFLGGDTPTPDIAMASQRPKAIGILIAFSPCSNPVLSGEKLADLSSRIAGYCPIAHGGNKEIPQVDGVRRTPSFETLDAWFAKLS